MVYLSRWQGIYCTVLLPLKCRTKKGRGVTRSQIHQIPETYNSPVLEGMGVTHKINLSLRYVHAGVFHTDLQPGEVVRQVRIGTIHLSDWGYNTGEWVGRWVVFKICNAKILGLGIWGIWFSNKTQDICFGKNKNVRWGNAFLHPPPKKNPKQTRYCVGNWVVMLLFKNKGMGRGVFKNGGKRKGLGMWPLKKLTNKLSNKKKIKNKEGFRLFNSEYKTKDYIQLDKGRVGLRK